MKNCKVVETSIDRPNIYLDIQQRGSNVDPYDSYEKIIVPLALKLKEMKTDFPMTVIYVRSKSWCGEAYEMIRDIMGDEQYHTKVDRPNVTHRLFCQFHAKTTEDTQKAIISLLTEEHPKLRLVVATVALGMGLDCRCIQQIIHIRPPTNLVAYFQQIGRAGREGSQASAVLYYNNSDLADKNMHESMKLYCKANSCLRQVIMTYFASMKSETTNGPCCKICDDAEADNS